jgi:carboxypeptidase C (cathepsin A)
MLFKGARSFVSELSSVVASGVQTLIWAGDADWICNTQGVEAVVNTISYPNSAEFQAKALTPYTVNGIEGGLFKTAGNLSFLRVYGAGHEVPYYSPKLALQAFSQTLAKQALSST